MSILSLREVVVLSRIVGGLLAGSSLALFAICIAKVFDPRFGPAVKPWVSTLPAVALSNALLWNIVAILTRSRVRPYVHIIGDLTAIFLLAVLGATGFDHDNKSYLKNGIWRQYDNENWLRTEIWAASILLVTCILQLLLVFLGWFQYRKDRKEFLEKCRVGNSENSAEAVAQSPKPFLQDPGKVFVKTEVIVERKKSEESSNSSDMDPEDNY